eukprot:g37388.t1
MLEHSEIKKEVVLDLLKSIKIDKFPGPGAKGEVPDDWRVANVVPLFKKGNRDNPRNNRPVVKKVINEGRAVDVACMDFSKAFDKVPCEVFKKVSTKVDEGEPVDVLYSDLQKAFNKLPHIKRYG